MDQEFNNFIIEVEPASETETELFFPFETEERELKVRLDKWLWAARFFKTRALARAAVENGKVSYNGQRSKPSREIELGAVLNIRMGRFERVVSVTGLSTRRHNTQKAEELYEETEESRLLREQHSRDFQFDTQYAESAYLPEGASPDYKPRRQGRFLRRPFARTNENPAFLPQSQLEPEYEFET